MAAIRFPNGREVLAQRMTQDALDRKRHFIGRERDPSESERQQSQAQSIEDDVMSRAFPTQATAFPHGSD